MAEPQGNKSGVIGRQLGDQLKTVFIVGLLSLWLAALKSGVNVALKRQPWWYSAITSALVLLLYFLWGIKKVPVRGLRWATPFVMVGFVWIAYWISGLSFPAGLFIWLAGGLFIWAFVLFLALILIMTRWRSKGKLSKAIKWIVKWGDIAYWPLSFIVLLTSVLLGWIRLWDAGVRGWWMDPLLVLGVLMSIVVALTSLGRTRQDES